MKATQVLLLVLVLFVLSPGNYYYKSITASSHFLKIVYCHCYYYLRGLVYIMDICLQNTERVTEFALICSRILVVWV